MASPESNLKIISNLILILLCRHLTFLRIAIPNICKNSLVLSLSSPATILDGLALTELPVVNTK